MHQYSFLYRSRDLGQIKEAKKTSILIAMAIFVLIVAQHFAGPFLLGKRFNIIVQYSFYFIVPLAVC